MAKSKLTLIVDGNWLMMSRLSVLNNQYKDDNQLCHDLKLLMIKSINNVLRNFTDIDNIIFISDKGSWRKHLEIPKCMTKEVFGDSIEYKGTRIYDDSLDWDMIFKSFDNFINLLNETGITVSQSPYIEGDDWAWHWSTLLNSQGTNVMIWSKDKDLTQLVKTNITTKCFTVWWNKDNGLVTEKIENDTNDDLSWMFNYECKDNNDVLNRLKTKSCKTEYIVPLEVVVEKIFMGDSSDNVFPLVLRNSKTAGVTKKFRISRKDLNMSIDITNDDEIKSYLNNLYNLQTYKDRAILKKDDEFEHFLYNKRLIWLDESSYPQDILEEMRKHTTYNISKDCSIAESKLQSETLGIDSILETI